MKDNIQAIYPLTPLQNGMLFHAIVDEKQYAYFQQVRCKFEGTVNECLIRETWDDLIKRHEVLRSVFIWKHEKEPLHVVLRELDVPITFMDWKNDEKANNSNRLEILLEKDRANKFDLSKPPLMRFLIIQININQFELIWSHHHILVDGWSTGLLFTEFQKIYESKSSQKSPKLPPPFPYKNYVNWLKKQDEKESELFWSNYLNGFSAQTVLPNDRGFLGDESLEYQLDISKELSGRLISFAAKEKVTPNVLFLGIWALLLSRYQTEEEVLLGITVSGRSAEIANIENGMGLFINSLPIRIATHVNNNLSSWLKEVQDNLLSIRKYEHTSLSKIKEWSDMPPSSPLFDSLFVFENYPVSNNVTHEFGEIKLVSTEIYERTNYPLTIVVEPQEEFIALKFLFKPARIDSDDIKQIATNYINLLENVTRKDSITSQKNVSEIGLLTKEKSTELINNWNNTETPYNENICMHQLFEIQCKKTPNNLAVVDSQGGLSYAELNQSANKIAHSLLDFGIQSGEYVAVFFNRNKAMIPALLGILKSGGIYVPIDVNNPTARIKYILESLNIRFALSQEKNAEALIKTGCLAQNQIICLLENGEIDTQCQDNPVNYATHAENPSLFISAENYAYVIFTSGSTGTPKGVTVTHKPVINLIEWITKEFLVNEKDQVLLVSSLCFDLSVYDIFGLLAEGGSIRVASDEDIKDPNKLLQLILNEPITFWDSAPAALQQLVPFLPSKKIESKLRLVFQSGDWIPLSLPNKIKFVFPNISFISLGGATEATVWSNFYRVKEINPKWKSIPYGKPIQNARYYILDNQLNVCPPGVPGNLYIGGECLSSLYANEPELTRQKFIPDVYSNKKDGRMYFTGDKASFYPDGNIEFLGRVDDQVKVRGYRIELKEIQTCLSKHTSVNTSIVIVKNDNAGYKQIVAYYTLEVNQQTSENILKKYLESILPKYMIPASIILLDNIPITSNGKLDRKSLPDAQPVTQPNVNNDKPLNVTEELIWNSWESLLGVKPVNRNANFFDSGGHSLLATRLIARLRVALSLDISVKSIFENPTPATLKTYLDTLGSNKNMVSVAWEKANNQTKRLLSFAQERLLFLHHLKPESSFYNVPLTVKLSGALNRTALEKSINELVKRHEILRSTYHLTDENGYQIIHQPHDVNLLHLDFEKNLNPLSEALEELKNEAQIPFNLTKKPLVRVTLIKTSSKEYLFQLTTHHIAIDGWSIGLLIKELQALYNGYCKSKEHVFEAMEYQYGDYAEWQRNYLNKGVLEGQLAYWKKQLHLFQPLQLPNNQINLNTEETNLRFRAVLDTDKTDALRKFSKDHNCTLFMTLLTSFNVLLHAITKQEDIIIGTDVANRTHVNTENIIGFFVNQIVLRNQVLGYLTVKDLLKQIRTNTILAYQHQDVPFEKLVQYLSPPRQVNQMPFFNVKMVLQNNDITALKMDGLDIEIVNIQTNDSKYDILMTIEDKESLEVCMEYKSSLYDAKTIEKWWNDMLLVLDKMMFSTTCSVKEMAAFIEQKQAINTDQEKRRIGLQKLRKLRTE
jgi:amino acid adenylation domain-containing protein